METGEKYLSGSMRTGDALTKVLIAINQKKDYIDFVAFKQKTKEKETSPDYKGDCSIWIKEKKPKVETEDVI